jgi:hypothetical protein
MRWMLALWLLMSLIGCASSPATLQRETARLIGLQGSPSSVVISNIDRRMMSVSWTATAQGRSYHCNADDMMHRPHCREGR